MSAEDQELLAKIGQVAGRINRHKSQHTGSNPVPSYHHSPYNRMFTVPGGAYRAGVDCFEDAGHTNGWHRGSSYSSRGHRGARMPTHRHRSLVLNNQPQTNKPGDMDSGTNSDASGSSWITKTDRHLQLINSSVFEKETQARTRSIDQTRRQKQAQRDVRERTKLVNHLYHLSTSSGNGSQAPDKYEITIEGIRFTVAKNGSKLVKVANDNNAPKATPKIAVVGGVKFYRSKNGNLYRHGIVKAQRKSGTVKKVNVPCKKFSTTGSCSQGPRCRYVHDPTKVAICKDFLQKGECVNGDSCDLSHDCSPERTPACLHFVKDNCTKADCRYTHVKVSPDAPVCRPFGIYGYCDKGAKCTDRHVFECPDFSNTGVCKTKGCKLLHRERASVLRKALQNNSNATADNDMDDISSEDDGDSVDSYDVDSDEVDEFIGQDGSGQLDFIEQKDFIQL